MSKSKQTNKTGGQTNETGGQDEIPVEGVDSIFEAVQRPELMKQWLEGFAPENLEKCQQESDHSGAHTLGENIVSSYGWGNWVSTMESLENIADPATGEPPHGILRHPGALLDNIIHLSEMDNIRLGDIQKLDEIQEDEEQLENLPKTRRRVFEYVADDETPVDPSDLTQIGGVDAAIYGSPGSGKSSLAVTMAARIMEINNEAVVWRGSPARTEWLPLAPWTTLCLPAGVGVEATLAPPDDDSTDAGINFDPVEIDLEKAVRKVVRYDNLEDLNHNCIERGGFHVVYPDPRFRECEAVTRRSSETKPLDYTSAWEAAQSDELDANDVTPTRFWWYAWLISHVSEGMAMSISWFCDEIKALFPNSAEKEDHNQPRYIRAISDKYIDMRRNGFSFYGIGHNLNKQFSHHIRDLMRWGVTMNGKKNPVEESVLSGSASMTDDYASSMGVGMALFWNAVRNAYHEFSWSDIPRRYKVQGKIRISYPGVKEVKQSC